MGKVAKPLHWGGFEEVGEKRLVDFLEANLPATTTLSPTVSMLSPWGTKFLDIMNMTFSS